MTALWLAAIITSASCEPGEIHGRKFDICYRNATREFDLRRFERRLTIFGRYLEKKLGISKADLAGWYGESNLTVSFVPYAERSEMRCYPGKTVVALRQWDDLDSMVHEFLHVAQTYLFGRCDFAPDEEIAHADPKEWFFPVHCVGGKCRGNADNTPWESLIAGGIFDYERVGARAEEFWSTDYATVDHFWP